MSSLMQPGLGRRRSSGVVERWTHRVILILFVVLWTATVLRQFPAIAATIVWSWLEPTLLVVGLSTTVSSLSQRIPLQNTILAASVVALLGGSAHWLSFTTGIPLGPIQFPNAIDKSPFHEWFCVPAILWVVILLNAREVALRILGLLPPKQNRGLKLIGLTTVLVVVMALMLEPFASRAHPYWLWRGTRLPITWEGVPLSAFLGWAMVAVICQIAATAALIDKHPRPAPPAIEAVWIWIMMASLFGVGNAIAHLWAATVVAVLVIAGGFALVVLQWWNRQTPRD